MARGSTKAELEAEVEKLREYKTLTKLRMKQAAEKLGSYRVQLEECQATIESLKESVTSQHQTIEHQAKTIRALTDKVAAMEASESTPAAAPAAPPMTHLESAAIRSDPWLSLASSDNDEPDTNNGATATAAASSDDDSSSSGSSSSTTSDESDVETQPAAHPETTSLFGQNKQISSPPFSHPATSLFPSPTHATPNTDIKPVVATITQQSFDTPNHTSPSTPCAKPAASPSKSAASSAQSSATAPTRSPPTQTTASMPKDTARPHATTVTTTTAASSPRKRALCPGDSKEDTMSPPLKAAKTTAIAGAPSATPPPTELVALSSALQKPMAKHMRAELVIQAYLTALRTSDDPTTRALCLTKTVKNLVAHHHVPVPAIAAAVLKIGSKSVIESTVCVDLLWQVTHPRRADLLVVLHAIGSHVRKTFNRHNTQVQASWCRVHVLLCRRATWIAASRSFLVDRLLEVNRSIWDFVTMVQSWPQIFAQLGDGDDNVTAAATSSLLPTTIRFLMGNMCREEEAKAKDNNAEYFSELYRVCRLDPPLSDDWYLDKFQARFEVTTFETCESVRLLLRVQGWQWCADHHIVPNKPDDQLTPTALRVMGVAAAAVYVMFGVGGVPHLINQSKLLGETLMRVLNAASTEVVATEEGHHRRQIAAATALVELAQGVPTKALRTEYVAAVVRWFQGQSPTGQLSQSTSFVRQLHHVVAMDVA